MPVVFMANKPVRQEPSPLISSLLVPEGTGIVSTALKAGMAESSLITKLVNSMTKLNKRAAELMLEAGDINAATDITGFGFLGHACEMVEESDVGMLVYASKVPFFPEVQKLAEKGIMPGGLHRNKKFRLSMIDVDASCPEWLLDVLFDPQTAGGLLISLPPDLADNLLGKMHREGIEEAAIVGEIIDLPAGRIKVIGDSH